MMSLEASFFQKERKPTPNLDIFSSKKRKWAEEVEESKGEGFTIKARKLWKKEQENIELHSDAPLPLEWQRCLDIKSGQIHFYNTRTHRRTSKDPRSRPEPPLSSRPSLDLELNLKLTCNNYPTKQICDGDQEPNLHEEWRRNDDNSSNSSLDDPIDRQEMVAAVCTRCHMLVMMCKASPSCPNCKFVHPQGQSSFSSLLPKNGFRLLCCKD